MSPSQSLNGVISAFLFSLFNKTKWWNRNELKPFGPKKLVIRNYDFFYALFITMEEMRKIIEIEHESLDYISNFFNNFDYNNPNLNIWDVASSIGTNRSYVSNIINEGMGYNFNHFVNDYRISEAKVLLKNKPYLSITEIGELSGFGSLNTFIRTFKQFENCTPTEFKLKIL